MEPFIAISQMRKLKLGEVNNLHKITQLSGGGKINTRQYSSRAVLLSAYSMADRNTGILAYTSGSCEFDWLETMALKKTWYLKV